MLEKIRVDQLEIGMHVHSLCSRWIDHPLWRTRFTVRDARELTTLRSSGVAECWIDTAKGGRPRDAKNPEAQARRSAPTDEQPGPLAGDDSTDSRQELAARVTFDEELERAASVCRQAGVAVESLFREARLGRALDAGTCVPLADAIASSVSRHPVALLSLARIRTHHGYTFLHSVAVSALMFALARELGQDHATAKDAGLAGLLHDVGKAAIPAAMLNKPGTLSEAEYDLVRGHPRHGHEMLREGCASNAAILDVCLHHHERFDGKGYPDGLQGESIPLTARMNAVCDVYDAITSTRPYKEAWDPAQSLARMGVWTRSGQFDPAIFRAFVNTVGIYPVGSLVRMHSGRLAVVVEQNPSAPARPWVKVFFSTRTGMPIPVERIDLSRAGTQDGIVDRESNAEWRFTHLNELLLGAPTLRRVTSPG